VTLALTSEHVRQGLGADGDADAATAEVRAYRRLGGRHAVLAIRGSAAVSGGDAVVTRRFGLGGSGPQTPLLDYGRDGLGLLRGFEPGSVVGGRLAVVNVDYRRPLVWIERGHGLWPLFARSLHGAVFADVGHAWDHAFALADAKSAAGVELSLDAVVGYSVPLTLTAGGAWRHDGTRRREDGLAFYFRVGRAF
jgi:outer membrane protein assembly factor BamA